MSLKTPCNRADPDLVKVSIRLGKKITDDMVIKRTSETHQTRRIIPPEIRDMSTPTPSTRCTFNTPVLLRNARPY